MNARSKRRVTRIESPYVNQYHTKVEQKGRRKRGLMKRLIAIHIAFLVIIGVMATYHFNQQAQQAELQKEYEILTDEFATVQKEHDQLSEEVDLLHDEAYILDIARTNYFLSKEGELIFKTSHQEKRSY